MRFLVAIPVFNEERYLRGVLAEVRKYTDEILVIDDGSTDSTPQLLAAERSLSRLRHPENRGYGQSLIDAFSFATERDYDWLITMDCDEQHEPSRIPCFMAAAEQDDADIISGSRYLKVLSGNSLPPPDRRRINGIITDMLNRILALSITDAFCGFKAYRVQSLRELAITIPGYAMPLQLWVQAAQAGLRVKEIPVRLIYKDPHRHFGGMLDDPEARLQHYISVLINQLGEAGLLTKLQPRSEARCCRPSESC